MILKFAMFIDEVLSLLSGTNYLIEYRIAGDADHTGAFLDVATPDALIRLTVFGDGSHEVTAVGSKTGVEYFRKALGLIDLQGAAERTLEHIDKANGLSNKGDNGC